MAGADEVAGSIVLTPDASDLQALAWERGRTQVVAV
jgi:hypothetical protein